MLILTSCLSKETLSRKMKLLLVVTSLLACALAVPHASGRISWPRLPLKSLLDKGLKRSDKIVGGEPAAEDEFPFQISLQYRYFSGWTHICGGSIYNENWVVCAAHCVEDFVLSELRVMAGEYSQSMDSGFEQPRTIDRWTYHENYNYRTFENDVSVIHVTEPFDFSDGHAGPIPLPLPLQETEVGTVITVTGWGTLNSGDSDLPDLLHKVDIPVVSDDECRAAYGVSDITDSMICAGRPSGGIDSCQGDSGGPLFTQNPLELIGIVSWGYGCAVPGYPGVYTQVSYFVDWIEKNAV